MENKNIYDEIFDTSCSVCGRKIKKDVYDQGDCPFCKWKNNHFADINPNTVFYPNLISLNKAKQLYKAGKPFEPNLDEFIEALFFIVKRSLNTKALILRLNLLAKIKMS